MAYHQDLDLHKPLDRELPSTIRRTPLLPRLALAALTLHGDFYRQLQSKCNARIFWHPATQVFMITVLSITAVYQFHELWEISDTWSEFGTLVGRNKYLFASIFPSLIFVAGTVGLTSFLLTDEMRVISDRLAGDAYQQKLFGFPLKIYANASQKDFELQKTREFVESASNSTELIEYRESPIAVVTVVPLPDRSSSDTFYAQITGFHVRKAYKESGLQEELVEIALEKARSLASKYAQENSIQSQTLKSVLLCDTYSFDDLNKQALEKKGFKRQLSTTQIDPFIGSQAKPENFLYIIPDAVVKKFFGVFREAYQIKIGEQTPDIPAETILPKQEGSARKRKT